MKDYQFIHNIFLDSCGFDPSDQIEQDASFKILEWAEQDVVSLILSDSVLEEIRNFNTPSWIQEIAGRFVITLRTDLTPEEQIRKKAIEAVVIGTGQDANHKQDALHIFMADKWGKYFITTDNRLLKRRERIKQVSTGLMICKPIEFINIVMNDLKFQKLHKVKMEMLKRKTN